MNGDVTSPSNATDNNTADATPPAPDSPEKALIEIHTKPQLSPVVETTNLLGAAALEMQNRSPGTNNEQISTDIRIVPGPNGPDVIMHALQSQ